MLGVIFSFTVVTASPAAARPESDACARGGDRTACFEAHPAETLDRFALPDAESRLAAGESIRRVMVRDAWGRGRIAIVFRRAPGHEPIVAIHPARGMSGFGAAPGLSAAVPLDAWNRISAASAFFDRTLAPVSSSSRANGDVMICLDGNTVYVETTDPDDPRPHRRLRRKVVHACGPDLAAAYAGELAATALRLLPACRGLDRAGGPLAALQSCAMLDGDRMAAAEVYDLLRPLRDPDSADQLLGLFRPDSRLDWNGTPATGARAASLAWFQHRAGDEGGHFFISRVVGETARRVRVEGFLERNVDAPGATRFLHAPVVLTVTGPPGQGWQVASGRVGAFARYDPVPED